MVPHHYDSEDLAGADPEVMAAVKKRLHIEGLALAEARELRAMVQESQKAIGPLLKAITQLRDMTSAQKSLLRAIHNDLMHLGIIQSAPQKVEAALKALDNLVEGRIKWMADRDSMPEWPADVHLKVEDEE